MVDDGDYRFDAFTIGAVLAHKNGSREPKKRYWMGLLPDQDDYGMAYKDEMFDAPTLDGPWANMTRENWMEHGRSRKLGTGYGQRYVREGNRWLHAEG